MTNTDTDPDPRPGGGTRDEEESALDTVRELERALHDLAAELPFEAEPSHHARLMDELAPEPRGDE